MFKIGDLIATQEDDWYLYEVLKVSENGVPIQIRNSHRRFGNDGDWEETNSTFTHNYESLWSTIEWVKFNLPNHLSSPLERKIRQLQVKYKKHMESKGLKCPYTIIS